MDIGSYPKLSIHKLMSAPGSAALQIKAMDGPELLECKLEMLQLKEQGITVSAIQGGKEQIINIKGSDKLPSVATEFEVIDPLSKLKIGTVKRQAWKPFQRSIWYLTDAQGTEIGSLSETNAFLAILHELHFLSIIPKKYTVQLGSDRVAKFSRMPLIDVLWLDFSDDRNASLDRRLGLAAGIVLCVVGK